MSDKVINKIVDCLEECSLLYFDATAPETENTGATDYRTEKLHSNFYECLLAIENYFLNGEPLEIIDDKVFNTINEKLDELRELSDGEGISNEDARRALLLLDLKGFKDVNYSYDIITPDAISELIGILTEYLFLNKKELTIFDPNFGIGNLAFYLSCHLNKDVKLVGFESHELLARVSCVKANMIEQELELHYDDCLNLLPTDLDVVISDIASYDYENANYSSPLYDKGVRYFPYLLIEHYLNLKKEVPFIYLIDNDFFNQSGSDLFRSMLLNNGHIVSLISLPTDFFVNYDNGKSILILNNNVDKTESTEVYQLPSLKDIEGFKKVLNNIKQHLQK